MRKHFPQDPNTSSDFFMTELCLQTHKLWVFFIICKYEKYPLASVWVRIIHVSETFGESCLNVRRDVLMTSQVNKTAGAELRRAHFCQRLVGGITPRPGYSCVVLFLVFLELLISLHMPKMTPFFKRHYFWNTMQYLRKSGLSLRCNHGKKLKNLERR